MDILMMTMSLTEIQEDHQTLQDSMLDLKIGTAIRLVFDLV